MGWIQDSSAPLAMTSPEQFLYDVIFKKDVMFYFRYTWSNRFVRPESICARKEMALHEFCLNLVVNHVQLQKSCFCDCQTGFYSSFCYVVEPSFIHVHLKYQTVYLSQTHFNYEVCKIYRFQTGKKCFLYAVLHSPTPPGPELSLQTGLK